MDIPKDMDTDTQTHKHTEKEEVALFSYFK